MPATQKNTIITAIKVLATLLVVYIHGANIFGYAGYEMPLQLKPFKCLADAAVPAFFVVSGFLMFRNEIDWRINLRKKTIRLAVPFLLWSLFWIAFEAIGYVILPDKFESVFSWDWLSWLRKIIGIPFYISPLYRPLWYVRDLFLLSITAPIIQKPLKKYPLFFMAIAVTVWFTKLPHVCREAITFFTVGGSVSACKTALVKVKKHLGARMLLCTGIPGLLLSLIKNETCYRISVLFMLAFIYLISVMMVKSKPIEKLVLVIMPYSFAIYVMHGKILSILQILYSARFDSLSMIILGYYMIPLLVFAFCMAVAMAFKRLLPTIYAIATGESSKKTRDGSAC